MSTPYLQVRELTKSYGGVSVLRGVDLDVRSGEIHGLIGANGAGKSTLIDILCGQTPGDGGVLTLGGKPITGGTATRSRMGMSRTFQQPQVAKELTLEENISVGLAGTDFGTTRGVLRSITKAMALPHIAKDSRVHDAATAVGLTGLDRLAAEVSFGEMRLVEVARALVSRPGLVILDEPFPGVGDRGLTATCRALDALRAQGHAVLLVDHNVDVVLGIADRVSLLAEGAIVFDGTPDECRTDQTFRTVYLGADDE